ncbi:segregation and condensation protein A [Methylopila jiangsuensis]|uniref:Segregation and condensation protein A n=1 Tax=Methylopila jiangsuensis TaxID=586230 RepID=A0A9W6JGJ4_9HYPH|nr:ScpA family protein [Methylopila jiangsuensis]MDR6286100.1 segregation and condensation protein A [Methylopila jiangsuensis]GLK75858.1 segregation and condensation protein A [Methylopila jiangsuensis]
MAASPGDPALKAPFEADAGAEAEGPAFVVDLDGFEGPLDLLLDLARRQKVDLARISILALAEQYLAFVEAARAERFDLAADYLVMAAWLAYLKSRLLAPDPKEPDGDEPPPEMVAAALAFRLRRLEAMRRAGEALTARPRLGQDRFARGAADPQGAAGAPLWTASLYDLLTSYVRLRMKTLKTAHTVARRPTWTLAEAREALQRLVGRSADWARLDALMLRYMTPEMRATVLASSLGASLELAREGRLELRQERAFGPLYLRGALPLAPDPDVPSKRFRR